MGRAVVCVLTACRPLCPRVCRQIGTASIALELTVTRNAIAHAFSSLRMLRRCDLAPRAPWSIHASRRARHSPQYPLGARVETCSDRPIYAQRETGETLVQEGVLVSE